MDELLKIILDYGLTGGALVVMSYALILMVKYQEKRDSQFMEILGRMDSRLATHEEILRQVQVGMKDGIKLADEMSQAVDYCKAKHLQKSNN